MRYALPLVVLIVLACCDAAASKPAAKPKRPASTVKDRPPVSLPLVSRPVLSAAAEDHASEWPGYVRGVVYAGRMTRGPSRR